MCLGTRRSYKCKLASSSARVYVSDMRMDLWASALIKAFRDLLFLGKFSASSVILRGGGRIETRFTRKALLIVLTKGQSHSGTESEQSGTKPYNMSTEKLA